MLAGSDGPRGARMSSVKLVLEPWCVELAYCNGIFPMGEEGTDAVYWFKPDPRTVIPLDGFHTSRSLRKVIRQGRFEVSVNQDFLGVMRACADRREGTWITEPFYEVYGALHTQGKAHSVECWLDGRLVGGLYGVALGGAFMAESMFHYETDASKVALAALVDHLNERRFALLDVQYLTPHLASLGAIEIPGKRYERMLATALRRRCRFGDATGPDQPSPGML